MRGWEKRENDGGGKSSKIYFKYIWIYPHVKPLNANGIINFKNWWRNEEFQRMKHQGSSL
jgi:hypothetical protein